MKITIVDAREAATFRQHPEEAAPDPARVAELVKLAQAEADEEKRQKKAKREAKREAEGRREEGTSGASSSGQRTATAEGDREDATSRGRPHEEVVAKQEH